MAMKMTMDEFVGIDAFGEPSPDVITAKMALEVQADAFLQMKRLGMKQKDLAREMGVSPAAVSKLFASGANPQFSSIARVASALRCDVVPPKLVPIGDQPSTETSSTLSSGMTVTMTVEPRAKKPVTDERDSSDPIDNEYRELCAQAMGFDSVEASQELVSTGLGDLSMAGVAA